MVRWLRLAVTALVLLAILSTGVVFGLFLVANAGWVEVAVPVWFHRFLGNAPIEIWLPALLFGWLLSAVLVAAMLLWSMYYLWRRRQYEALIKRIERELSDLRNLPVDDPAPLEDLPELPSQHASALMEKASRQIEERARS